VIKFKKAIEKDRSLINNALKKCLTNLKGPAAIKQAMRYVVFSGGKRLRPILTLECAKILGGNKRNALPFACAVELVHNFSLVHDDLPSMDDDNTRRGKLTCHKKFNEGTAILAGDGLINLAFNILAKEKNGSKAIKILTNAIGTEGMLGGQVLDLAYERLKKKNKKLKNKINKMKTAHLMAASCVLGALSAGEQNIKRINKFGMNLGCAFQVADDIRDSKLRKNELKKMQEKTKSFIRKSKNYEKAFNKKADTLNYIANIVLSRAGIKI